MPNASANVTEDEIRNYISVFHSTLQETACEFLPVVFRPKLLHLSLLPARIVGYVSTQFGIAIEYVPATATSIETVRGGARVEDLIFRPPKAVRKRAPFFGLGRRNLNVDDARCPGMLPVRLSNEGSRTILRNAESWEGSWRRRVFYAEIDGNRRAENWTATKAVSKAKDEVLAALVDIRCAERTALEVSEYVARLREKRVLLLGAYDGEGNTRLAALAKGLEQLGYEPFLVRDVPDSPEQDLRQKVLLLGSLSRFVVADDSSPSGHLVEMELCRTSGWITVVLRARGTGSSWMTAGLSLASNVIREVPYDPSDPTPALSVSLAWAEARIAELRADFRNTYPWR